MVPPRHTLAGKKWWGRFADFFRSIRRNLFSRFDRYIIFKFLGTYFFSIVLIISVAVVFDFSEHSDKFTMNHAPMIGLIKYYFNFVPFYTNLFSALFVFIAVIFFTSKLAENSEIIAMMSTGISFGRLLRPYMVASAFIAIISFYLGAEVIPRGSVKRVQFEMRYKNKKKPLVADHVQLQVDTGVIAYIDHFEGTTKTGYRFSLDKFQNKSLVSHLTAQRIQYDSLADERFHWKLYDVKIRTLLGLREHITTKHFLDSVIIMEPQDFFVLKNQQQTLTNDQLLDYIERQKLRGAGNVKVFEMEYNKRYADPFAAFILSAIGLALSFRKRKGGMGASLGIGLALAALYIMLQTISSTFAINSGWPSVIAAWMPNFLFTLVAVWLYQKARR
ncbi:MAG: LptF/LptG family permease [Bacteroidales bacterium]|nr:LptF/LptG family permease [Bacteroidales bacterium]